MNNCIWCHCVQCGNEFHLPVPNLLDDEDNATIGDMYWCGVCDSHDYECFWGMFAAGTSTDKIGDVLRIWTEWASSYSAIRSQQNR